MLRNKLSVIEHICRTCLVEGTKMVNIKNFFDSEFSKTKKTIAEVLMELSTSLNVNKLLNLMSIKFL